MFLKVGARGVGVSQHRLHVVFVSVRIIMAAVVLVDGTLLVFWLVVPATRNKVVRHAQDGVFGIEEVNLAVSMGIYGHIEYRWFELHQTDRPGR